MWLTLRQSQREVGDGLARGLDEVVYFGMHWALSQHALLPYAGRHPVQAGRHCRGVWQRPCRNCHPPGGQYARPSGRGLLWPQQGRPMATMRSWCWMECNRAACRQGAAVGGDWRAAGC